MLAIIAALKTAKGFLAMIPPWVFAVVLVFGLGFYLGHSRMEEKFEEYKQAQSDLAKTRVIEAEKITTKEVIKYVDRIKVVHEKGDAIIEKVPIYVPRDVCLLPPGFRSVHDAAATGGVLPDTPGVTNAAPVDAQDVASTVAGNYSTCHATEEQLLALQSWVREQHKAAK